ncbi:hypothetical protein CDAR_290061 [Caerostris darwini]|uniref:Uncharacterized protein n=1 Tax=Caerostris darwini TaxID=1538125 RepID=A0AAV4WYY5_9ARAC|nr:hypothetical protein CDAR_290061 [Caerostris darwini]
MWSCSVLYKNYRIQTLSRNDKSFQPLLIFLTSSSAAANWICYHNEEDGPQTHLSSHKTLTELTLSPFAKRHSLRPPPPTT